MGWWSVGPGALSAPDSSEVLVAGSVSLLLTALVQEGPTSPALCVCVCVYEKSQLHPRPFALVQVEKGEEVGRTTWSPTPPHPEFLQDLSQGPLL